MKKLKEYIAEAHIAEAHITEASNSAVYNVMLRIKNTKNGASFLFANNIWVPASTDTEKTVSDIIEQLEKVHPVFEDFDIPERAANNSNVFIGRNEEFELRVTFNRYGGLDYGDKFNMDSPSTWWKDRTTRWSETPAEREDRFKNFERSEFSLLCASYSKKPFELK